MKKSSSYRNRRYTLLDKKLKKNLTGSYHLEIYTSKHKLEKVDMDSFIKENGKIDKLLLRNLKEYRSTVMLFMSF